MSSILARRDVRHHDVCPATDIDSRDGVGISSERARHAAKRIRTRPVALMLAAAFGTRSGGIARVNVDDRHSGKPGLVLDERPELMK